MRRFVSFFGAGFALGLGALVAAASGDLIFETTGPQARVKITGAQALSYATLAITHGAWDGAAADMNQLCVTNEPGGFYVSVLGNKTAAPSVMPLNVRVVGRVP